MRFRQTENTDIPTIDLIPMLTVMMGVLAFFVVVSVSLSSEQLIQVDLPPEQANDASSDANASQEPFIVEIDATGQLLLNAAPVEAEPLAAQMETYLARNPDKIIYLVPNRQLPYQDVMKFLGEMRAVGGDRVSLALEETPETVADPPADPAADSATPAADN